MIPKPEKVKKKPKRMAYIGKVGQKWIAFRAQYLLTHPPDSNGEYVCAICGKNVHYREVTLDHIIPRSRAPHLRFVDSNIQFAHYQCNSDKGSKVL